MDHSHLPCGAEAHECPAHEPTLAEVLQRLDREVTHSSCDTGRYLCRYYVWGDGPPLLLVPGLGIDARSFVLLCEQLSRSFRCVAYDLPTGQGDGAHLDRHSHADLVADVLAIADHARLGKCNVLGHSFGSTIALAALHKNPDRFPRAVLLGGFARRPLARTEVLLLRFLRYWQAPLRKVPFLHELMRQNHHRHFADKPAELWDFFLERLGQVPIPAFAHRALLVNEVDLRPILGQIGQPILRVSGDEDSLVKTSYLEGLPNLASVELPDCGHYPLLTHPGHLSELVRQFLLGAEQTPAQAGQSTCPTIQNSHFHNS